MKKTFATLICSILVSATLFAQETVDAHFNECVDLVSIVWRLSGSHEYNMCLASEYAKDADAFFESHRNHPAVQLAHQYATQSGIAYDAVAAYGLHLQVDANNNIVVRNDIKEGSDDSFDRWSSHQKQAFLTVLNDFYHESHFHEWYIQQADLYRRVEEVFSTLNQHIDYAWFGRFFGPQEGAQFHITLSLLVGPQNYGCSALKTDGTTILTPVIGCCRIDANGGIAYNAESVLPLIIHEFSHPYCNPLINQYWQRMEQSAESVYQEKRDELTRAAYASARIMMYETFVRASVIRYLQTHFPNLRERELVAAEDQAGFILTQNVCDALKQYEEQRNRYATMSDFMPTLSDAINSFKMKDYLKMQKNNDKHLATYKVNIKNGAKGIPSGTFTVEITFSKPMVNEIAMGPSQSGFSFPEYKGHRWSTDQKTIYVDFQLQPQHSYGIRVLGSLFHTLDGYTAKGDQDIIFSTR